MRPGGQVRRMRLWQRAHGEELVDVSQGERCDAVALARADVDELFLRQALECRAHCGPTDAVLLRELLFGDRGARRELTIDDRSLDSDVGLMHE